MKLSHTVPKLSHFLLRPGPLGVGAGVTVPIISTYVRFVKALIVRLSDETQSTRRAQTEWDKLFAQCILSIGETMAYTRSPPGSEAVGLGRVS